MSTKVSTKSRSDDYNILNNMLYFRLMRRLERGTLSKSIGNFFIDTMYRAVVAAVMLPFAFCYEVVMGIKNSKIGNSFYTLCFYTGVFGSFFTVGIAIVKTIAMVDSLMAYLDAVLGSSNTMFITMIAFDILAVTTGYFLGVKPSLSEASDDFDSETVEEAKDNSVVVSDVESPSGTKIRVSTRCA